MMAILTNPRERTRFLRFLVVGTIGAVIDFGVANLLVYVFHAPLVVAGTISFIAAIISNFTWNRYWTYPDSRAKPLLRQLIQFSAISVMGLGIRIPLLHFLEPPMIRLFSSLPFGLPVFSINLLGKNYTLAITADFLGKNFTLAIAVLVVLFWNFFVNRYITYNDVKS
jgi:putative flippase GtrA